MSADAAGRACGGGMEAAAAEGRAGAAGVTCTDAAGAGVGWDGVHDTTGQTVDVGVVGWADVSAALDEPEAAAGVDMGAFAAGFATGRGLFRLKLSFLAGACEDAGSAEGSAATTAPEAAALGSCVEAVVAVTSGEMAITATALAGGRGGETGRAAGTGASAGAGADTGVGAGAATANGAAVSVRAGIGFATGLTTVSTAELTTGAASGAGGDTAGALCSRDGGAFIGGAAGAAGLAEGSEICAAAAAAGLMGAGATIGRAAAGIGGDLAAGFCGGAGGETGAAGAAVDVCKVAAGAADG